MMNLLEILENDIVTRFARRHLLIPIPPMSAIIECDQSAVFVKTFNDRIRSVSIVEFIDDEDESYSTVAVMGVDVFGRFHCDVIGIERAWDGDGRPLVSTVGGMRMRDDRAATSRAWFDPLETVGRIWSPSDRNLPAIDRLETLTSRLLDPRSRQLVPFVGPSQIVTRRMVRGGKTE